MRRVKGNLLVLTALSGALAARAPADGVAEFRNGMASLATHSSLSRAGTGVAVISLRGNEFLYAYNEHVPLIPASNMKLIVGMVALCALGPDFRFQTTAQAVPSMWRPETGTLEGSLFLVGSGDPTLCTADLKEMAAALRAGGLARVAGDIVADSSCFADRGFWRNWDDRHHGKGYAPEVCGLSLNWNSVEVVVAPAAKIGAPAIVRTTPQTAYVSVRTTAITAPGSQTASLSIRMHGNEATVSGRLSKSHAAVTVRRLIHEPDLYAGQVFKEALEAYGIEVGGQVVLGQAPLAAVTLAAHESVPLADIITPMMKHSANLTAENVFRAASVPFDGRGSVPASAGLALQLFERAGASTAEIRIADGCGLSEQNRVSADALAKLLRCAWVDDYHPDVLLGSLPIAGVDGTLSHRLRESEGRNHICAKTGTLTGVSALSGYAASSDGDLLSFSVLMNGFHGGAGRARAIQDRMCSLLVALDRGAAAPVGPVRPAANEGG
jgi:D-alanyl-D-alanine carboxypeptidase/D-alanyl-D-alanine-endopeptidase (penicillin-binding protein 4)